MVIKMCTCTCANTSLSVGQLKTGQEREGGRQGGREPGEEGVREEEEKRERERQGNKEREGGREGGRCEGCVRSGEERGRRGR